jgi:hypothetical protein
MTWRFLKGFDIHNHVTLAAFFFLFYTSLSSLFREQSFVSRLFALMRTKGRREGLDVFTRWYDLLESEAIL